MFFWIKTFEKIEKLNKETLTEILMRDRLQEKVGNFKDNGKKIN